MSTRRLRASAWPSSVEADALLGALACGEGPHPVGAAALGLPVLPGSVPGADVWLGRAPVRAGRTGDVHWRQDGDWLFGAIDLDEADAGEDLQALARRAYTDVFNALEAGGCPQLLRLWNYLPDIHGEQAGLERYRQFNIGRQQAFLAAERPAFDGAPAACALGTRQGPLSVRFLAGRQAPLALENPRQVSAYRYPADYGPSSPTFSRAALFDVGEGRLALSISGTASIVGHESRHPGDVRAQTEETVRNLQALIDVARARSDAAFSLPGLTATVYVREAEDAATVRAILAEALGEDSPCLRSLWLLQADVCRRELLVEIEAHAVVAGRVAQVSTEGAP